MEVSLDLAALDAILDVRLDPILDVLVDARAAMHQRDARAGPEQFERRDGRGVLCADHDHVVIVIGMRLPCSNGSPCRQILARDVQHVGNIVVAGGKHNFARAILRHLRRL